MSTKRAVADDDDDRFPMVLVEEEDLVWDDNLGYHRCPLDLIQTPREIVQCYELSRDEGGLKLYLQQLEREGICDVVVVDEDEHEVCIRAITCARDRERARHPQIIIMHHRWYQLPKLNGRALIDAETGKEIWVGRFEDAIAADADESRTELDATADPDLDIPF